MTEKNMPHLVLPITEPDATKLVEQLQDWANRSLQQDIMLAGQLLRQASENCAEFKQLDKVMTQLWRIDSNKDICADDRAGPKAVLMAHVASLIDSKVGDNFVANFEKALGRPERRNSTDRCRATVILDLEILRLFHNSTDPVNDWTCLWTYLDKVFSTEPGELVSLDSKLRTRYQMVPTIATVLKWCAAAEPKRSESTSLRMSEEWFCESLNFKPTTNLFRLFLSRKLYADQLIPIMVCVLVTTSRTGCFDGGLNDMTLAPNSYASVVNGNIIFSKGIQNIGFANQKQCLGGAPQCVKNVRILEWARSEPKKAKAELKKRHRDVIYDIADNIQFNSASPEAWLIEEFVQRAILTMNE